MKGKHVTSSSGSHPSTFLRRGRTGLALVVTAALSFGALGGTLASAEEPEPLASREVQFTQLNAGANQTLAIGEDGRAYGWGTNVQGRVGDGTTENRLSPVLLDAVSLAFTQVAAGNAHSLGLTADGDVYAWGAGTQGKLGDGTTAEHHSPTLASALPADTNFVQVDAGKFHSLALTDDGLIYGWGANSRGQLGNGATADVMIPALATGPDGVRFTKVAGGEQHTIALSTDGGVFAAGYNSSGQLGTGDTASSTTLVPVAFAGVLPDGAKIIDIAAGESSFSLALADNGTIYAWGANTNGQLGNGSSTNSLVPVAVTAPEGVTFSSLDAGRNWSIARSTDGRVFAWGNNRYGQLGNGEAGTGVTSPLPVEVVEPAGVDLVTIGAGANHALAIGDNGLAYTWGSGLSNLGNGSSSDSFAPTEVMLPLAFAPDLVPELVSADVEGTSLTVTWNDAAVDGYRVRLHPVVGDDITIDTAGDHTSTAIEGLTPGSDFEVSVAALNWVGAGRFSAVQHVHVPAIATQVSATTASHVYGTTTTLKAKVTPATAVGEVSVKIGSKTYRATVDAGSAKITLPAKVKTAGTQTLAVTFTPADATHTASTTRATYSVTKAKPLSVTATGKAFAKKSKPTISVKVGKLTNGAYPTGKVTVKVGSYSKTVHLKAAHKGAVKIKLNKKFSKSITAKASFAPSDTKNVVAAKAKAVTVKVKK